MNIRQTISTGLVAIALTASMGASAGIKSTENSVRVDLSDLDLSTASGQKTMNVRLERAAKQVCGSTDIKLAGSLHLARENRSCFNESLSNAISDVEASYMTASIDNGIVVEMGS